jgi:hypothetical protein
VPSLGAITPLDLVFTKGVILLSSVSFTGHAAQCPEHGKCLLQPINAKPEYLNKPMSNIS